MAAPDSRTPDLENQHHRYVGSDIPWYVHLLWISFWVFCLYYVYRYQFPVIQTELLSPP